MRKKNTQIVIKTSFIHILKESFGGKAETKREISTNMHLTTFKKIILRSHKNARAKSQ